MSVFASKLSAQRGQNVPASFPHLAQCVLSVDLLTYSYLDSNPSLASFSELLNLSRKIQVSEVAKNLPGLPILVFFISNLQLTVLMTLFY